MHAALCSHFLVVSLLLSFGFHQVLYISVDAAYSTGEKRTPIICLEMQVLSQILRVCVQTHKLLYHDWWQLCCRGRSHCGESQPAKMCDRIVCSQITLLQRMSLLTFRIALDSCKYAVSSLIVLHMLSHSQKVTYLHGGWHCLSFRS